MAIQKFNSPKAELVWVTITGEGKENLSGKLQYVASQILEESNPEHKAFMDSIRAYWEENKPAKFDKDAKSLGIYPYTEKDADGNKVEIPGKFLVAYKTGTSYPDGSAKVIHTHNAKGAKVFLGDTKIGNGSIGRIAGAMGIYENKTPKGALVDAGVTLYFDAIQITKLVKYESGPEFAADDDEDGWTGEDDSNSFVDETASKPEVQEKAKPRL